MTDITAIPTAEQLAVEVRQREAIDTFVAAATSAAPRWFVYFAWTFSCRSGDWTQGRGVSETLGGVIAITFVGRSEKWCVEAHRDGHSLLLRSDVDDADLGDALTVAWIALVNADAEDRPHGLAGPSVPFPAASLGVVLILVTAAWASVALCSR